MLALTRDVPAYPDGYGPTNAVVLEVPGHPHPITIYLSYGGGNDRAKMTFDCDPAVAISRKEVYQPGRRSSGLKALEGDRDA